MRRALAGFLAGALFFAHSVSFAQDEAVIITAPRFPEDVRRLPASVTVITEDDIKRSAARTLPELLEREVGFTMKDLFGNNAANTSIDLRGFGVTGPQNTLILLDGRPLNDLDLSGVQWASIPLASIERVEIIRGSGAVLYGNGATAGVVNIITRSPLTPGSSVELMGRAGSYETVEGQLYASHGSGAFGINGSIYGYGSEGYRANNRNAQQNNTLNLRWAVADGALDFRFGTDKQDIRLPGGRFVQPSIGLDQFATSPRGATTPLDYASRDGTRGRFSFSQRIGDADFSVGVDTRDKDQRSYFDQNGFPSYRADTLKYDSITPRVRIPVANHTFVTGIDWQWWRYRSERTDRPENLSQPTNSVAISQDTVGFYLQDTISVTRSTLVTAGYRYERAKYTADDSVDFTAPPCTVPFAFCAAAPSARDTQEQYAWELGLREAFTRSWAGFARAGRSFRFANVEEIYESDIFFAPQFQMLRPQHALTYEGGAEWKTGPDLLRVTLFQIDVSDEIHLDPFTTGVGNTNLPPSRRRGFELDGKKRLGTFDFAGTYAYTEAKFLEGTIAGSPFAIGTNMPIGGHQVPLVPRHKVNLTAGWEPVSRTRLAVQFTGVSEQVMDNDEVNTLGTRIPAYYLVDVKLTQAFGWGRVGATVNNLFNEKYYDYAVRSAFAPNFDRYSVYPLPERAFYVTLEIKL